MNVKHHAKERYCERILGMNPKDKNAIKQYIAQNDEQLIKNIIKMYGNSSFIWKGQFGDNITRNYYIADNVIIVADTDNTVIITLFKVDFGFPEQTNRLVIKDLRNEIENLKSQLQDAEHEAELYTASNNEDIKNIDLDIQLYNERLEVLKRKKKLKEDENQLMFKQTKAIQQEIYKYANQLCNSIEIRNDFAPAK